MKLIRQYKGGFAIYRRYFRYCGKNVRIIFDLARYNRIPVIAEGVRAKTLRVN